MHLDWINILERPPISDHAFCDCHERVNLFIGPNASGKSTILRAIQVLWSQNVELIPPEDMEDTERITFRCELYGPINGYLRGGSIYAQVSDDWVRDESDLDSHLLGMVPLLYIPSTRVNLPGQNILDGTIDKVDNACNDAPLEKLFDTDSGVFHGHYVALATNWLRETMTTNRRGQEQLGKALQLGYSCAKSICLEVIDDYAPHPYIEVRHDGSIYPERVVHHNMGIGTSDDMSGEPLYAGALSSGTQGTLLWVWALALKMASHYCWQEGWEEKPAILLIDEIENHLHPTWQRRVIPALLEHFPKLQIFATTHSPFVVAGREAGQVHLLNRDENGVVTATPNKQDVIGWTADEILRTMMGVTDPTDGDTAKAAVELRELRNELPRADEQEEEERQQRIQELRQRVNRDLLAGGPMAAQRELFQQNLAEILEEHRRSQNLGQE